MTQRYGGHAPPRHRGHDSWLLLGIAVPSVLALVAAGIVGMQAQPVARGEKEPPAAPAFGVLGSRCVTDRATALAAAGVQFAELELSWSAAEPAPGVFDRQYLARVKSMVDRCRRAGLGVVATLGLHSAPQWVSELPAGAYRDQWGNQGPDDVPDLVFSSAVRRAVAAYLNGLDTVVPLTTFAAIRVGTGDHGELGYPSAGVPGSSFWAFDEAAQSGTGLADGVSVTPLPGWTPGSTRWHGTVVTPADTREWFDWYAGSVAGAVVWVVQTVRGLGFHGDIHLPLAGRGALPADLDAALRSRLSGAGDRDGSLASGLYYPDQLHLIADSLQRTEQPGWGAVSADVAGVDDATAVSARALHPPQDSCRPGDATVDLTTARDVATWSSFRWTIAAARQAGLGVIGENPGSPDTPGTGADSSTDSSAQQLVHASRYAWQCGLTLLMWAFEDDLFGQGSSISVAAYARQIEEYR